MKLKFARNVSLITVCKTKVSCQYTDADRLVGLLRRRQAPRTVLLGYWLESNVTEWRILGDKTHGFSVANLSRLDMTDLAVWMVLMILICDPKCRFSSKISKDRFPTAASLWYYLVWFAEWPDRHWTIHHEPTHYLCRRNISSDSESRFSLPCSLAGCEADDDY